MIIEILLILITILLLIVIITNRKTNTIDIESSISKVLNESGLYTKIGELTAHAQNLTISAKDINETLDKKSEELTVHYQNLTMNTKDINETLDKKVGELKIQTEDIRQSHKSIEQMLRVPKERAPFGELSLEIILSDQLPPDMFGIRQKILDGKIPDAYIKSTVGLICIDSKFPLDNYAKMEETKDIQEKENFKKQFIKDVDGHLNKIAYSYVCPQRGSAEFAFAYIPSEGVYYFLMTEAYQMLWNHAKKGVQMASPLMLSSKIELIKTGVQAKKLSEDTEKVRNDIIRIAHEFKGIDESWRLFYGTHFSRAAVKAGEVDQGYRKLREEFGKISKLTDNKQVSIEKPIITIPSSEQCVATIPYNTIGDKKTIKDKRIIGGKLRKVEMFNGNVIRVFDDDGSIIEDRSAKFGDKLPIIEQKEKVGQKLDNEEQIISSQTDDTVVVSDAEYLEKDEKYKEFTKFYEDFLNQIIDGITVSKTGDIAAPISSIIDDAKKVVCIVDGSEKEFLKGMNTYFDMRGIRTDIIDNKHTTFKKKGGDGNIITHKTK